MRENMGIYRGKRKDTGEWVEGNLIESDNSHYPMVLIGHVITSRDKHTNALSFDGFDLCEVDPSTVGQYTGLLDKNGKRIFEGDIVRCGTGRICKVTFFISPGVSGFDLVPIGGFDAPPPHNWSLFAETEVIGNIHDGGFGDD